MEETVELEIPILLPGVENDSDGCLERLEAALMQRKGILHAHLELENEPIDLCVHYDPHRLSLVEVRRLAESAGAQIVNRYRHETIPIEGMDCSDCAMVIEHSLSRIDGVLSVSVSYALENLWIEYDSLLVSRSEVEKRVRSLGYQIPLGDAQRRLLENRALIFSLLSGVLALAGWTGSQFIAFSEPLSTAFYLAAYLFGGWDPTRHAWHALRSRQFDTDLLMVLAALGAAALGRFGEGALLLFLFSLGHALQERLLSRTRKAVGALAELAPRTALVRLERGEVEMPVASLALGQVVVVRPGERIPVDGNVLKGTSGVDQAALTGESLPADKAPGDSVFAGTINGSGALEVQVARLAKDSTLARVMKLVESAQAQKSPTQQTVERFERVFVPGVLALTTLVIFVPPLFGLPWREAFLRAMTLLVAASPCALALGTPAAVLSGIAQAARNGVLVKGGVYLEALGRLDAVAFDKTGTITLGKPAVTDIVSDGLSQEELLALAAGVESRSSHPLAGAVVQAAHERAIPLAEVGAVELLSGHGLRAEHQGRMVHLGSQDLLVALSVLPSSEAAAHAERLQAEGKTLVWVLINRQIAGLIALADTVRPEASAAAAELKQLGVRHTVMLTGDNPQAAAAIAAQVGLDDVRAGLLPEQKLEAVRDLLRKYGHVAMVGDGVNDAPALANATVGIAMGGAGSDAALQSADVALMGDDLSRLPFALGLGRFTRTVINQNLAIALGVILLLVVASLGGLVSIGLAVLLHEGSTLLVVLNALRLLGYRAT